MKMVALHIVDVIIEITSINPDPNPTGATTTTPYTLLEGQVFNENLERATGRIKICTASACDNDIAEDIQQVNFTPKHECC